MTSNDIIGLWQDQRKHDKQLADKRAVYEAGKLEFYLNTLHKHIDLNKARLKKG